MAVNDKGYPDDVTIWDAALMFKNFEGRGDSMNAEGKRNFNVRLPEDVAADMIADGWNVKPIPPREGEENEPRVYRIPVEVSFRVKAPEIYLINGNSRTLLDESLVSLLDHARIEKIDLTINASKWNVNGQSGIKAYLRKAYVTLVYDALDDAYAETKLTSGAE